MRTAQKRREVSDEDFRRAYYGIPGDEQSILAAVDNQNIIQSVLVKYRLAISRDDLETCGMVAMWRCLQYHDPNRPSKADPSKPCNQKLTTSLHTFVTWECLRELRKVKNQEKRAAKHGCRQYPTENLDNILTLNKKHYRDEHREKMSVLFEYMDLLPFKWQRKVLKQYYFDGLTMSQIGVVNGYSKEAARQKIGKAVRTLRGLCLAEQREDGVLSFGMKGDTCQSQKQNQTSDASMAPLSRMA
jgi:DNA-directed RNA polymerase specialized sigma subunit